jgi:hypothetical protein
MGFLDPQPLTAVALDGATAARIDDPGSDTRVALDATIGLDRRPANVRDSTFGAVGDGIANDTAAINAALATDRDVYLPPGTYRLVAATGFALLNTQKRRSIYGSGVGTTMLKLDSGGEGGVIDATGATLSDLSIDGGFNPATAQSNLLSCVQANSNSTVRNVHVYNARGSCLVGVGSRIAFINNRLEKFGDHAIYFSGDLGTTAPYNVLATSSRLIVQGNIIDDDPTYHNGAAGGPVRGAVKFRNNIIDAAVTGNTIAGDQCILIDGDTRRAEACPRRIVVTGNTLLASYSGVQINTTIDATAGDTGIRVGEVIITGNTIYGSDADNTGIHLSRARASITNNTFTTTAGIGNFETGDTGASVISGNTFRGCVTGIYKAGTASLIEGNIFEGITGGWAVQCTYHNTVRGNVFSGCAVGLVIRTATHATNTLIIQGNTFMNNTLGMDVGEFARSVTMVDNIFTGNTTTATVITGASFNGFNVANNRVISGGAFPTVGSTDTIAIAPVTPLATVSALPTAASGLRGRMVRVVGGVGVADQAYICRKNAADAYEWAPVL